MAGGEVESVVLADGSGGFYAVPLEVIERYRVTDEYAAGMETLMGGAEVSGYVHPLIKRTVRALGSSGYTWAALAGYYIPEIALQQNVSNRAKHA
jgi:hypothetical protein